MAHGKHVQKRYKYYVNVSRAPSRGYLHGETRRRPFNRSKTMLGTTLDDVRNLEPPPGLLPIIIGIDPSLLPTRSVSFSLPLLPPRMPPPFIIHNGQHQNSVILRYIARSAPTKSATFLQRNILCSFQQPDCPSLDFLQRTLGEDKYLSLFNLNFRILRTEYDTRFQLTPLHSFAKYPIGARADSIFPRLKRRRSGCCLNQRRDFRVTECL